MRSGTAELLHQHGLDGQAAPEDILTQVGAAFAHRERVAAGPAAVLGGMVSGALTGLGADLATGGLTLGGGLIAGGLLGALGAAGLAHGINRVRGQDGSWACWQPAALDAMVETALLRYLAVAHFGRGRGEWVRTAAPAHWRTQVAASLQPRHEALAAIWARRDDPATTAAALQTLLAAAAAEVLGQLYPDAAAATALSPDPSPSA